MTKPMTLVAAVALLAGPALADDTILYSDMQVRDCLDVNADQPRACIGLSAAACQNASDAGSTTIGLQECSAHETTFWDDRLNATYGELMTRAEEADEANKDDPRATEKIADKLRDMQKIWIGFRDATCAYEASQFQGGTIAGPIYAGCELRMTAEQAIYLEGSWPTN